MYSEKDFMEIYKRCREFTTTSIERMYSLYKAVEYVVSRGIPGGIVECGVWKGGSTMLCALTLIKLERTEKRLYLYDTYTGMTRPGEKDVSYNDEQARERWEEIEKRENTGWCRSSLEEVKGNLYSTGYPGEKLLFVEGKVEETIPSTMPERISVLRLDTDWYESTYHELMHLFPRLSENGVIIIDDYGHWRGAKEAVDRYFSETDIRILLNRIDYTGRIGVKTRPTT